MKKLLSLLLALCMVLSLGLAAAEQKELKRVAFIVKGYSDTYCLLVSDIFAKYAKEKYGDLYEVTLFDGEMSNETINNLIDTCVADKYDVIIFEQNDPDTPVANVKAAVAAGIPVIVTVGSINDDGESAFFDANPVQQGSLLTTYAIEQGIVKEGTNVVLLRGIDGTFHADGRHDGFVQDLEKVKANIVDDQTANWSTSEALPIVEAWLISHPEIEVIFAANDDMALGAIQAMKAADRMDIKVFSVDANELGCQALIDGELTASVAQDTFGYAHGAADAAAKVINGEKIEGVRLDSKLILPEQVDEVLIQVHGYTEEEVAKLHEEAAKK
ncbi:MAG: sugar ABC transporter substrate-binding protein [Eubacteriales bacterium]|nr:sugar ABC transporter substrate-binding protein [Eubacteriales bacterium]